MLQRRAMQNWKRLRPACWHSRQSDKGIMTFSFEVMPECGCPADRHPFQEAGLEPVHRIDIALSEQAVATGGPLGTG